GRRYPRAAGARAGGGGARPPGEDPGLEASHYFKVPRMAYTNGVHVATVEVDPETGQTRILGYVIAHDCGRMINPSIVEGQILGGLRCGIGNALLEGDRHRPAGHPLTPAYPGYP